jgi:hypothetical protein
MTFRSSMLVTLTAAVVAVGWVAATADVDTTGPLRRPAAAPTTSPARPSPDCDGRTGLDLKVCGDLPLSGDDDTASVRIPLRPGRFGR